MVNEHELEKVISMSTNQARQHRSCEEGNVLDFVHFIVRDDFKTQPPVDRGFRTVPAVYSVLNNDNRPKPDGTGGRPAIEFWSRL